ncbi:MAG: 5-oxoprolinase, partial [Anaerolineae bacterium]
MKRVFLHPFAGVLSAYGMGLADVRALRERQVEQPFAEPLIAELEAAFADLERAARREVRDQGVAAAHIALRRKVHLRYEGTDSPLLVDFAGPQAMRRAFEESHRQRFGFVARERKLVAEAVAVEAIGTSE